MARPGAGALRVVVVSPPFYAVPPRGYGGIERVCYALVEGLVDLGHDVTLVAVGPDGTRARLVTTADEAPTEAVEDHVLAEVRHALIAERVIADVRPDVVHEHTRTGLVAVRGRSCPTVATAHAAVRGPESHAELYRALPADVALVALSQSQRDDDPDLPWVATVPNGIRVEDHPLVRRAADYVLYLGRLGPTKGVHLAIAAARRAGRRLVLAGGGTSVSESAYVREEILPQLGDGVDWAGPVDDDQKRELFARAACLVMPVRWREPFGLVVVEAMASGVPVVAFRTGAMPELVVDGVTGILCDDVDDLPAAFDRAEDLDAGACRAWVEQCFSAERMARGYERVYREAIRRHERR